VLLFLTQAISINLFQLLIAFCESFIVFREVEPVNCDSYKSWLKENNKEIQGIGMRQRLYFVKELEIQYSVTCI